jgi:hypothetical protein
MKIDSFKGSHICPTSTLRFTIACGMTPKIKMNFQSDKQQATLKNHVYFFVGFSVLKNSRLIVQLGQSLTLKLAYTPTHHHPPPPQTFGPITGSIAEIRYASLCQPN